MKPKDIPGLVEGLHSLCMFTGTNTSIGYELDEIKESWDEFKLWMNAVTRVIQQARASGEWKRTSAW